MTSNNLNSQTIRELNRLIEPGLLGFFSHFEATEIFMIIDDEKSRAFNVFTILVAEHRSEQLSQKPVYLNDKPIRIKKIKNCFFWN